MTNVRNFVAGALWAVYVDEAAGGSFMSSGGNGTVLVRADDAADARRKVIEYGRRLGQRWDGWNFDIGPVQRLEHSETILIERSVTASTDIQIEGKQIIDEGNGAAA